MAKISLNQITRALLKNYEKLATLGWDIIDTLQKPNRVKLCHNYLEIPTATVQKLPLIRVVV